jgi:hypothetical protein
MSAKPHEASAPVRNLLALTQRISQTKKSDPADLQQVLLLVAELNRAQVGAN